MTSEFFLTSSQGADGNGRSMVADAELPVSAFRLRQPHLQLAEAVYRSLVRRER